LIVADLSTGKWAVPGAYSENGDNSFAANRPRWQGSVSMPVDEAATFGYPRERSFLNSGSKTFGYPRQAP